MRIRERFQRMTIDDECDLALSIGTPLTSTTFPEAIGGMVAKANMNELYTVSQ